MNKYFDKQHYKQLKTFAKESKVHTLSVDLTGEYYGYNGLTVAYCLSFQSKDCRMLEVAVSYCAPEDKFKKKHGKYTALSNFLRGVTVKVPLGLFYNETSIEEVEQVLIDMFAV